MTEAIIPITKPWLDEQEAEAAKRPILSGWVTQGPEVKKFEQEFAAYVGAEHACAVSNCTAALHIALLTVGVQPGDEVVTVSHSFIATANSIRYCGANPVFVDIEPDTFNMNPQLVEREITECTRAILCVHQMGMPCDLTGIFEIAQRYSLPVIEDAACAIGSDILWNNRWEKIGKPHGDIACFSFHPRKVITTGDGGMLTTFNPEYNERFRLLRQHSMSVPDTVRHRAKDVIFESYLELGYNYRMTDIQAAVGRVQLGRLPEIIRCRRFLADRYTNMLLTIAGIGLPDSPSWVRSNWQSYCVRLPDQCDQRQTMQFMLDHGIATKRGIMCAHKEPAYTHGKNVPAFCQKLKESELAQAQCIILPLYPQMTESEQDRVVEVLFEACKMQKS